MRAGRKHGAPQLEGYRALSTSLHSAVLFPEWKQEVNRRVAAHQSRKTSSKARPPRPLKTGPRVAAGLPRPQRGWPRATPMHPATTKCSPARRAPRCMPPRPPQKPHSRRMPPFSTFWMALKLPTRLSLPGSPSPSPSAAASPWWFHHRKSCRSGPRSRPRAAIAPAWELETDAQPDEAESYDGPPRYDRPAIMEAHQPASPANWFSPFMPT